ncbi:MAG: DUF1232 domain-containing protein [bacterium]
MLENPFGLQLLNPINFFRFIWHVPDFLKLFYRLFMDSRVPLYLKLLLVGTLLYIISPVDFIPELLIPIIGGFDDIILLILCLRVFLSWSPREVVLEHVTRIDREKQLKKQAK